MREVRIEPLRGADLQFWRGSSFSDDAVIIVRNFTRKYLDTNQVSRPYIGFRLVRPRADTDEG